MPTHSAAGPTERLLGFHQEILSLQEAIAEKRRNWRIMKSLAIFPVIIFPGALIATALTWREVNFGPINLFIIPASILSVIGGVVFFNNTYDGSDGSSIKDLELKLQIAEERRRLNAYDLRTPVPARQYAYRESLPDEVKRLRKGSQRYRNVHNTFQSVIIIGSLATTAAASMSDAPSPFKEITIGLSFLVGISAGFTGYFKYRERGFYLQQTADAIEEHLTAFELGISPYEQTDEPRNLTQLATAVEGLRVEQRKREQQLDQPHQAGEQTN